MKDKVQVSWCFIDIFVNQTNTILKFKNVIDWSEEAIKGQLETVCVKEGKWIESGRKRASHLITKYNLKLFNSMYHQY